MRRTYLFAFIFILSLTAGYAAGREDASLPVFGRRQAVSETAELGEVVPLGMTIGVRIDTDGVMVLGTGSFAGEDNQTHNPAADVLQAGDMVTRVNDTPVTNKEVLARLIADSEGELTLTLRRGDEEKTVSLTPAVAVKDGVRRIGAWVRDSTKGIGTLTFFDPETQRFAALGHGIIDVDTRLLMSVKSGMIMPATVTSVRRGVRGAPGELEGTVQTNLILGRVTENTAGGIFGRLEDSTCAAFAAEAIPAAHRSQIKTGAATLLTDAVDNIVREYDIKIENINRFPTDATKSMVIRITDPALLEVTGGIVQGMSGSPILQNGKIVGAVTHVFVQDPTKGYGIFVEYMLHCGNAG